MSLNIPSSFIRPEDPAKRLEKIHVLVLDSSKQVTELFKSMLEEIGFSKIFVAHNGVQGIEILREIKINMIITDWELKIPRSQNSTSLNENTAEEMVPLSGVDFVKHLRSSPVSPNPFVSIIMLADSLQESQALSARDSGVNEICIKPLSAQELFDKIMSVIDRPRVFVTAQSYRGPCRRRKAIGWNKPERRLHEVRVIKYEQIA